MKFENLDVWKRAVKLSVEMYRQTQKLRDFGFKDQITRSALSVPSNIAEGYERNSVKERIHFLSYAKASCGELRTQLIIGEQVGFVNQEFAEWAINESRELACILASLMKKYRE